MNPSSRPEARRLALALLVTGWMSLVGCGGSTYSNAGGVRQHQDWNRYRQYPRYDHARRMQEATARNLAELAARNRRLEEEVRRLRRQRDADRAATRARIARLEREIERNRREAERARREAWDAIEAARRAEQRRRAREAGRPTGGKDPLPGPGEDLLGMPTGSGDGGKGGKRRPDPKGKDSGKEDPTVVRPELWEMERNATSLYARARVESIKLHRQLEELRKKPLPNTPPSRDTGGPVNIAEIDRWKATQKAARDKEVAELASRAKRVDTIRLQRATHVFDEYTRGLRAKRSHPAAATGRTKQLHAESLEILAKVPEAELTLAREKGEHSRAVRALLDRVDRFAASFAVDQKILDGTQTRMLAAATAS